MSVIMRWSLPSHRDFPTHQARQDQVASRLEFLVLQREYFALPERLIRDLTELVCESV
jgi:hypothetical protein